MSNEKETTQINDEEVAVTFPDNLSESKAEDYTEEDFIKQCWGKAFIQINLYALWRWQHLLSKSGVNSKKQVREEIVATLVEAQKQLTNQLVKEMAEIERKLKNV